MIQLPNNCYCSEIKVTPKNWEHARVSCKNTWVIYYRFYDPVHKSNPKYKTGKLVSIQGMNGFKTSAERQAVTRQLIDLELHKLAVLGYNPITGAYNPEVITEYEIAPETPIIQALKKALAMKTVEKHTMEDITNVLTHFETAADKLRYSNLRVRDTRRKHIIAILAKAGDLKGGWSAINFNKYRAYLHSLFKTLVKVEAIESNPVTEIERMKGVNKIRVTLSNDDRKRVIKHLSANHPELYRFIQIFFHSGARLTELLQLRVSAVKLEAQSFMITVKKGREHTEFLKPIKTVALPFWHEQLAGANQGDYVFSRGLIHGAKKIPTEYVTRRWHKHVKIELGITADLYSLKHLNTTEMVEAISDEAAAHLNSHASTEMVAKVYDIRRKKRLDELIKGVGNEL